MINLCSFIVINYLLVSIFIKNTFPSLVVYTILEASAEADGYKAITESSVNTVRCVPSAATQTISEEVTTSPLSESTIPTTQSLPIHFGARNIPKDTGLVPSELLT